MELPWLSSIVRVVCCCRPLQEYAGIKKDMVFSAQGNKVELWDKDTYYDYIRKQSAGFSDLAAEVAGGDFINPFEGL